MAATDPVTDHASDATLLGYGFRFPGAGMAPDFFPPDKRPCDWPDDRELVEIHILSDAPCVPDEPDVPPDADKEKPNDTPGKGSSASFADSA